MFHIVLTCLLALFGAIQASCTHREAGGRQAVLMRPYLQAASASGVTVMVETATRSPVTVDYGVGDALDAHAATSAAVRTSNGTYVQQVELRGLLPGTAYSYRVRTEGDTTERSTFRTLLTAGGSEPFRFAWMADCRTGTDIHDRIAGRIADAAPLFSLYGGDLCNSGGYAAFKTEFFRTRELALIARVPFFNATGNHETWGVNTRAFTRAPASLSGKQEYYSFDCGALHVLVLNTELSVAAGSPQYDFARRDLASSRAKWKIVIAHNHPFCAGGHGDDADLAHFARDVMATSGVQIMLSGHSHFYQHNLVDGIHFFVIGSAGAPLYSAERAPYTIVSLKKHCYAICDVDSTGLLLTAYDENGVALDSLRLHAAASQGSLEPSRSEDHRGSIRASGGSAPRAAVLPIRSCIDRRGRDERRQMHADSVACAGGLPSHGRPARLDNRRSNVV